MTAHKFIAGERVQLTQEAIVAGVDKQGCYRVLAGTVAYVRDDLGLLSVYCDGMRAPRLFAAKWWEPEGLAKAEEQA